eukprot:Ihof_evm3s97 gene=Ihof_evmTU3s97
MEGLIDDTEQWKSNIPEEPVVGSTDKKKKRRRISILKGNEPNPNNGDAKSRRGRRVSFAVNFETRTYEKNAEEWRDNSPKPRGSWSVTDDMIGPASDIDFTREPEPTPLSPLHSSLNGTEIDLYDPDMTGEDKDPLQQEVEDDEDEGESFLMEEEKKDKPALSIIQEAEHESSINSANPSFVGEVHNISILNNVPEGSADRTLGDSDMSMGSNVSFENNDPTLLPGRGGFTALVDESLEATKDNHGNQTMGDTDMSECSVMSENPMTSGDKALETSSVGQDQNDLHLKSMLDAVGSDEESAMNDTLGASEMDESMIEKTTEKVTTDIGDTASSGQQSVPEEAGQTDHTLGAADMSTISSLGEDSFEVEHTMVPGKTATYTLSVLPQVGLIETPQSTKDANGTLGQGDMSMDDSICEPAKEDIPAPASPTNQTQLDASMSFGEPTATMDLSAAAPVPQDDVTCHDITVYKGAPSTPSLPTANDFRPPTQSGGLNFGALLDDEPSMAGVEIARKPIDATIVDAQDMSIGEDMSEFQDNMSFTTSGQAQNVTESMFTVADQYSEANVTRYEATNMDVSIASDSYQDEPTQYIPEGMNGTVHGGDMDESTLAEANTQGQNEDEVRDTPIKSATTGPPVDAVGPSVNQQQPLPQTDTEATVYDGGMVESTPVKDSTTDKNKAAQSISFEDSNSSLAVFPNISPIAPIDFQEEERRPEKLSGMLSMIQRSVQRIHPNIALEYPVSPYRRSTRSMSAVHPNQLALAIIDPPSSHKRTAKSREQDIVESPVRTKRRTTTHRVLSPLPPSTPPNVLLAQAAAMRGTPASIRKMNEGTTPKSGPYQWPEPPSSRKRTVTPSKARSTPRPTNKSRLSDPGPVDMDTTCVTPDRTTTSQMNEDNSNELLSTPFRMAAMGKSKGLLEEKEFQGGIMDDSMGADDTEERERMDRTEKTEKTDKGEGEEGERTGEKEAVVENGKVTLEQVAEHMHLDLYVVDPPTPVKLPPSARHMVTGGLDQKLRITCMRIPKADAYEKSAEHMGKIINDLRRQRAYKVSELNRVQPHMLSELLELQGEGLAQLQQHMTTVKNQNAALVQAAWDNMKASFLGGHIDIMREKLANLKQVVPYSDVQEVEGVARAITSLRERLAGPAALLASGVTLDEIKQEAGIPALKENDLRRLEEIQAKYPKQQKELELAKKKLDALNEQCKQGERELERMQVHSAEFVVLAEAVDKKAKHLKELMEVQGYGLVSLSDSEMTFKSKVSPYGLHITLGDSLDSTDSTIKTLTSIKLTTSETPDPLLAALVDSISFDLFFDQCRTTKDVPRLLRGVSSMLLRTLDMYRDISLVGSLRGAVCKPNADKQGVSIQLTRSWADPWVAVTLTVPSLTASSVFPKDLDYQLTVLLGAQSI